MNIKSFCSIVILGFSIYSNIAVSNESVIPVDSQQIFDHMLSTVLGTTINDAQIEILRGGLSGDKLYLISHAGNTVVARIHQKNKNIKFKRLDYVASKNAADLGIGPKVLYVSKNYDLIVTEYVKAKHPDFKMLQNKKHVNQLVEGLLKLHNGPNFPNSWSVFDYIKRLIPIHPSVKEKIVIAELDKIEKKLHSSKFQSKPCHNDIHQNNLFFVENKFLFIDWGDAGMSDPFWDLARVSMEFAFSPKQDKYFLAKYLGKVTNVDTAHFFTMKQVFLIRSAFGLKNVAGGPDDEKLRDIIKVFEANNYPLDIKNDEKVTWNYLYIQAMDLFIRNSKTVLYQESLNILDRESKSKD